MGNSGGSIPGTIALSPKRNSAQNLRRNGEKQNTELSVCKPTHTTALKDSKPIITFKSFVLQTEHEKSTREMSDIETVRWLRPTGIAVKI